MTEQHTHPAQDEQLRPALGGEGLGKSYGPVVSLRDADFRSHYGRITGLIGDNGAGKSTLIKVLVGVERPTTGTVVLNGQAKSWSSAAQARQAGIETVFQDLALCPDLSVWRNFFLNREIKRRGPLAPMHGKAMREQTALGLEDFGLHLKSITAAVSSLSGGQRQGVAIARAVHFGAQVLIMDEPTNALSVYETEKVLESLTQAASHGLAVIVISHTLAHIHELADEIYVMYQAQPVARIPRGQLSITELEDIVAGRSAIGARTEAVSA